MSLEQRIPVLQKQADQRLTTVLGSSPYVIRLLWNDSGAYWSMSLYAVDMTPILLNIKMVKNFPLVKRFARDLLPRGDLYLMQEKGNSLRPGFDDLGLTHFLYYYEA